MALERSLFYVFFAFYYKYQEFDHSVVDFLNNYMKESTIKFDYNENRKLFEKVFALLSDALPDGITRRFKSTPINLYEAVTVGAAIAYTRHNEIKVENINEWIKSNELKSITSGATNSNPKVRKRIEYCLNKFEGK